MHSWWLNNKVIQTGLVVCFFFSNLFATPSTQSSLQAASPLQSVNAAPVWFPVLPLLFSSDSHLGKRHPRVPFPCSAFAPQIPFTIVVHLNTGTMKLPVTLEVTEITGLISSFLLYLHRWQRQAIQSQQNQQNAPNGTVIQKNKCIAGAPSCFPLSCEAVHWNIHFPYTKSSLTLCAWALAITQPMFQRLGRPKDQDIGIGGTPHLCNCS